MASWSGLLNRATLRWDAPLLEALGVPQDALSPLADAAEPLAGLVPEYAARWPALRDVPWFPAIGDGAAANLGSGCAAPGRVALTVGTTGALRVVLFDDRGEGASVGGPSAVVPAQVPAGLWCYRVDRRRALLGGATSEGGNVYAWMRETLRLGPPAQVERAIAALPPDGHGLTMLPFVAGERSPGWAGDARATISGITLGTTPVEIVRAGLEAVAYRFALIAEALGARAPGPDEAVRANPAHLISSPQLPTPQIVASGGALLASPAWMQIVADVLGRPVTASAEEEATSRGAALLALEALGAIPALEDVPAALGATYTPDAERHTTYRAAIARQRRLYEQIIGG